MSSVALYVVELTLVGGFDSFRAHQLFQALTDRFRTAVQAAVAEFVDGQIHAVLLSTRELKMRNDSRLRAHGMAKRVVENLLRGRAGSFSTESAYLGYCCAQIADYVATDDFSIKESVPSQFVDLRSPLALLERSQWQFFENAQWTQAIVPFRFSRGDRQYLLLGERHGRRPYLSEDLAILARLASVVVEVVEQFRNMELQKLATQAELRA